MKLESKLFSDEQLMLAFAFMADVESGKEIISKKSSRTSSITLIDGLLSKFNGNGDILEGWDLLFGPVLYTGGAKGGGMSRNATAIFYNSDVNSKNYNHMVIAVAGTNFIDKYDWFTEDVEVSTLVPWNKTIMKDGAKNTGTATSGYIAKGTATALQNTWNTKIKDWGQTPITWLKENIKAYNPTTLSVTGHSLGGAIAPVLATALHDNRALWNGQDVKTIKTYIYAGPTPGDEAFKKYAETHVNILSIINPMDVVPHAWDLDKLNLLYTLYELIFDGKPCKEDNDGRIVYWIIRYLVAQSENATRKPPITPIKKPIYKRWSNEKKNMINKGGDLITTKVVTPADADELLSKIGQATVNQLYNLTGAKTSAELATYTAHFLRFMVQMGVEHTDAYRNLMFQNTDFTDALKNIYAVKKSKEKDHKNFDAIEGGLVLQTLIATIDWYYIQTTQLNN